MKRSWLALALGSALLCSASSYAQETVTKTETKDEGHKVVTKSEEKEPGYKRKSKTTSKHGKTKTVTKEKGVPMDATTPPATTPPPPQF